MLVRWVALDQRGQRVGEAFLAEDLRHAYDRGCALHGPSCHLVQSLVSWEIAETELQAVARTRRIRLEEAW
jgi:hypothetical protein